MYGNKAQHEQSKSAGHSAEHSMQEMLSSQSGSSIKEKAITGVNSTDHGRRIIMKTTKQRFIFSGTLSDIGQFNKWVRVMTLWESEAKKWMGTLFEITLKNNKHSTLQVLGILRI